MLLLLAFACAPEVASGDSSDSPEATDSGEADTGTADTSPPSDTADTAPSDTADTAPSDTAALSDTADTAPSDTADSDTDCGWKTWYGDADGDGYGDPADGLDACDAPDGYTWNDDDCDDTRDDVYPRAPDDDCDGVDQDCDGAVDEAALVYAWRPDVDGDGFGDETVAGVDGCAGPAGSVHTTGDCDDTDASVSPVAREVCDGVDQDCDGRTDEMVGSVYYADTDGDGYGDAAAYAVLCGPTEGYVDDDTDCDDTSAAVSPGAPEVCGNAVDDDCDGTREGCGLAGAYDVTTGDLVASGASVAGFGVALAALGDLDGDGVVDVLVGEYGYRGDSVGAAYLLRGPFEEAISAADAALTMTGAGAGDGAGLVVAGAGDTTGDGVSDLLVTAYAADGVGAEAGAAYLVDGTATGPLPLSEATAIVLGEAAGDRAGLAAAALGDVDGDGLADVLVGAPGHETAGTARGAAYVVAGGSAGEVDLGGASAKLVGESLGAGRAVAAADLDGDGVRDAVVASSRTAYVVYLPVAGTLDLADADATITPTSGVDALAGVDDTDGDGLDDLVVSDEWHGTGQLLVYSAPVAGALRSWDAAGTVTGGLTDGLGETVAAGGDVDADGYADIVATAPAGGSYDRGEALLVYGPVRGARDAVFEVVGYELGITAAAGVGDTDGDGFCDVLVGHENAVYRFLGGEGW